VADILRLLAVECHYREGDAISAEGLYRSCLRYLDKPTADYRSRQVLIRVIFDYSALLSDVSWNNRSRASEGEALKQRVNTIITDWDSKLTSPSLLTQLPTLMLWQSQRESDWRSKMESRFVMEIERSMSSQLLARLPDWICTLYSF